MQANPLSPKSISIRDILIHIRSALAYLKEPGWFDRTANTLRVNIASGTLPTYASGATLPTVTTVTGVTNVDGIQGRVLMMASDQNAWASVVRRRWT